MFSKTMLAAAAVLLTTFVAAAPINGTAEFVDLEPRSFTCFKGPRVITVRGSNAPQDFVGPVEKMGMFVEEFVAGSQYSNLVYPATLDNYEYSVNFGIWSLAVEIVQHAVVCPQQRFILIGFSQGAQVIGDTLIGGPYTSGGGLAPQFRKNVIAVVQFGDPDFVPGLSFDRGTSHTAGVIHRQPENYDQYTSYGYAGKMASWCDANDKYCASGDSLVVHNSYMGNDAYTNAAREFMMARIKATDNGI